MHCRNDDLVGESIKRFKTEKIMTVEQVAECLGRSIPTARNRLKQWGTLRSYDKNGRYYVLPDVPRFDFNGLWSYRDIHFSKHGSLTNTLIGIIEQSRSGLDGAAIGRILGLDPRSFLSHFGKCSRLKREKISGRYVYFSCLRSIFEAQRADRGLAEESAREFVSQGVAITILVEKIKHPDLEVPALVAGIRKQGVKVSIESVAAFFARHGLLKKTRFQTFGVAEGSGGQDV